MKITKYEHACFTVENDGNVLVVDPGNYTTDFVAPENVVAVVLTHMHADHFDKDLLAQVIDKNPNAIIVAPADVVPQIEVFETRAVTGGDSVSLPGFELDFFGGEHAYIYEHTHVADNVGVLINDLIYYPGDSFTVPEKPVDTLALPIAAPWLKLAEVIDFALAIKPRFIFPTHDAILSDAGRGLHDTAVPRFVEGVEYKRIDGQTIDV